MYVEGKCARDVTRKEEAVVKEASEPSSQSGTSRYKLGKVAISYWSFFSRYKLGNNLSAFGRFSLSRHLRKGRRRREDTDERREVRVESFV